MHGTNRAPRAGDGSSGRRTARGGCLAGSAAHVRAHVYDKFESVFAACDGRSGPAERGVCWKYNALVLATYVSTRSSHRTGLGGTKPAVD